MLGLPERALTRTQLVDINNDGEQELVVQHPSGAHSTQLQAFGWRGAEIDAEFGEVASVYSNYASGFTVGDLDSDGRTEIASIEPDWKAGGASSASGPFVEVLQRWDGDNFREVHRHKLPSDARFQDVELKWFRRPPQEPTAS